ncbi:MAG TPA: tetratricopeptide repeat protein, partial [Nannocystaceae bacterium]|nr:tetratricopeptide repeat protein [Nannocystaceae bacterium]
EAQHLGALLALESLYRLVGAHAKLADVLARQAKASSDPIARAMMLRERVRVLELVGGGSVEDRVEAWTGVLAAHPNDRGALGGLELDALDSGDPRVIASVDARLAAAVSDPALRAAYLTRRAEALEASGGPQALDVYREALALDPESLAALRGMSRLAEVLGDGEALIEAAEREAAIAKSPRDAAESLVRAGNVRADQAGDREGAIGAFDTALQHWPDHPVAAERLSTLMRAQRQFARLTERLSRAAAEARDPARQRALWLEVGRLYARELENLGAAIAALDRLLKSQPEDAEALLELARLYASDRRVDDAMTLLRRCIVVADADELAEAQFELGNALQEKGEHAEAFRSYEQALQMRPDDHRILEKVVELQLATGMFGAAVDSAARLRAGATEPADIVAADIRLARAHLGMKRIDDAIDAFADAIMVEGPGGEASSELHGLATRPEHWRRYIEALRQSIGRAGGEPRPALYLELARVLYERLGDDAQAEAALVEGLQACDGDAGIRFELSNVMRRGLRYTEAVEQLQAVLMDDVVRVEAWRGLAQTFDELGHARARGIVHAGLGVLEVATPAEREDLRTWQPRTEVIKPGALAGDATSDLHVARDQQAPAAALLASIAEGLAKIRPPDLARWGVSGKDKLPQRPDVPLRALVDRIAGMFGIEDYDVYQHAQRDRAVFVENTPRPSILVPNWLAELPASAQAFLMTQAIVDLSRGLHTIELFTVRELEILLAAGARVHVAGFGDRVAAADVLDDHQRAIGKAISRKRRRAHEISASAYANQRGPDTATFVQWVRQSARRIALVVADDLPTCIAVVTRGENLLGKVGIAAVRGSPIVADLVRVWVSRPAFALRQTVGLLPPGPGA